MWENTTAQIIWVIFVYVHIMFQIFIYGINITTSNHDFLSHNIFVNTVKGLWYFIHTQSFYNFLKYF